MFFLASRAAKQNSTTTPDQRQSSFFALLLSNSDCKLIRPRCLGIGNLQWIIRRCYRARNTLATLHGLHHQITTARRSSIPQAARFRQRRFQSPCMQARARPRQHLSRSNPNCLLLPQPTASIINLSKHPRTSHLNSSSKHRTILSRRPPSSFHGRRDTMARLDVPALASILNTSSRQR